MTPETGNSPRGRGISAKPIQLLRDTSSNRIGRLRATTGKDDVAEALGIYAEEHAPTRKDPARIGYAIDALVPLFGNTPIANLTGAACRRYGKLRKRAPGTIRKELGTLQAAINYCHAEGYLTAPRRLRLPQKPPPRDRWLTRDEVARLIEASESRPDTAHLPWAGFALTVRPRYTGALDGQPEPCGSRHTGGGWIDTRSASC